MQLKLMQESTLREGSDADKNFVDGSDQLVAGNYNVLMKCIDICQLIC